VLFVGWILEAKGVRELLEAARALPEVRFTLVGPVQPGFVEAIRPELDALRDRVTLLPSLPREQVMELYRRADVFALPSHREGFPNVVLEAMAAALPVVATTVGAIPDAVRDGRDGILVPPRDAAALTAALRRLVEDRGERLSMGASARQRAVSVYALDAVVAQLEAIYLELVR
jgi:glycosyltransferase involved in cell wall biosynthesis